MENVGEISQSAFRVIELTGANRFKMWNPDSTFFMHLHLSRAAEIR